ncbi:MAG TPA: T9SS type A sorting domain-containing protein, partial [Bacteroidia bacterium]|nr:T9SS type A sorting domain-containing protein [Bacteroidia bacterium]
AVTVTDANGCMNADTMMATINPLPIVSFGSDITQCGGTVTLDAGNAGSTYLWSDTSTSQTLTISTSGTYAVVVTDANSCSGSDTIMVTINPLPTVTGTASSSVVCLNDAAVGLTGTPNGGTWSGPGVSGSSFTPMTAGTGTHTLTYNYTDANTCSNSATVTITVNACTGVEEQSLLNGVSVYPNPNNGIFTLSVNANVGDMKIVITDLQGRVVYSSNENNVNAGYVQQIDLQSETAGIYFIQISSNSEQRVDKISVQK